MQRTLVSLVLVSLAVALAAAAASAAPAEAPPADAPAAAPDAAAPPPAPAAEPFSIQRVMEDLQQKFRAGGLTMWVLLFLSVLGLAFVLERLFRLGRRRIAPVGFPERADRLWQAGQYDELLQLCRADGSTLAKVVSFVVRHRDAPIAEVNLATGDIASRDIGRHLMLTYPLAAVATLSPLLGLFGTVLGMIESFDVVAVAGSLGDPSLLASGISKALVTTAFGLFVAIPTLFFYHLFKLRTNFLASLLEEEASTLTSEWLMKGTRDAN